MSKVASATKKHQTTQTEPHLDLSQLLMLESLSLDG